MTIRFNCQNTECGKAIKVRAELAGKRVKCPGCGELQVAAGTGGAVASQSSRPPDVDAVTPEAPNWATINEGRRPRKRPLPSESGASLGAILLSLIPLLTLIALGVYVFTDRAEPKNPLLTLEELEGIWETTDRTVNISIAADGSFRYVERAATDQPGVMQATGFRGTLTSTTEGFEIRYSDTKTLSIKRGATRGIIELTPLSEKRTNPKRIILKKQ